jgi:hypothetical protein
MMEIFIRLDRKGEWRGVDHRSSISGLGEEFGDEFWEAGISCYKIDFDDLASTVEDLREYWMGVAMMKDPAEYEDFQVTIFRGERIEGCYGLNYEDLATCEETVAVVEARPFMEAIIRYFELYDEDELDEDEYRNLLIEALKKHVLSGVTGGGYQEVLSWKRRK